MTEEIELRRNGQYIFLGGLVGAFLSLLTSIWFELFANLFMVNLTPEQVSQLFISESVLLAFAFIVIFLWIIKQDKIIRELKAKNTQ